MFLHIQPHCGLVSPSAGGLGPPDRSERLLPKLLPFGNVQENAIAQHCSVICVREGKYYYEFINLNFLGGDPEKRSPGANAKRRLQRGSRKNRCRESTGHLQVSLLWGISPSCQGEASLVPSLEVEGGRREVKNGPGLHACKPWLSPALASWCCLLICFFSHQDV